MKNYKYNVLHYHFQSKKEFLEFGFMANEEPYPKGVATKKDLIYTVSNIIELLRAKFYLFSFVMHNL